MTPIQFLVETLLETDAAPMDPALDRVYRRWSRLHDAGITDRAIQQMIRDLDVSNLSFEGEPDARQQSLERQKHFPQKPEPQMYRKSAAQCRTRNEKRKSYGYKDTYSMRERGWPTDYRRPDGSIRKPRTKPVPVDEPEI